MLKAQHLSDWRGTESSMQQYVWDDQSSLWWSVELQRTCFINGNVIPCFVTILSFFSPSKEMGIPDHLTCLLRNLYACQEATVRAEHRTTDCFQIGKGVCQGCILSPCLFTLEEYIMQNAGLDEAQAGIKIVGEVSITSDMQMTPPLRQKVKRI